jgi:hypothetical protein
MEHFFHYLFEPGLVSSGPVRVALRIEAAYRIAQLQRRVNISSLYVVSRARWRV